MLAWLLAIVWAPTAGQYTLAARPTSINTEQVCFREVDAQDNDLGSLGCVNTDPSCLGDLPNCRLELVVTIPADGADRLVKAVAVRVVDGVTLTSGFGGDSAGKSGVIAGVPSVPLLVQ